MSAPAPSRPPGEPAPSLPWSTHVRAGALFLVLTLLVSGFAYPILLTEIAQEIAPSTAGGSLLTCPDGTVVGSSLLAQNLSAGALGPGLFWGRPSPTDYNTTLGIPTLPGPSDPALRALLNETVDYLVNESNGSLTVPLPFWWVAPSASGVDPDLVPGAVLVQIPRVNASSGVPVAVLLDLVNAHITEPPVPFLGVPYVNVLELDLALLELEGRC